jgi:hypothetical protein
LQARVLAAHSEMVTTLIAQMSDLLGRPPTNPMEMGLPLA